MTWTTENRVTGSAGPVVQTGPVAGSVHVGVDAAVRSGYRSRVASIAPTELVGRDEEVAELTGFCTSPENDGRYTWLCADAWSGKSALLSSFVLDPPPGVRVVSFFVSGASAGQGDRAALVQNLLEQLLEFLERPAPPLLDQATREGHVLHLLRDAAARCASRDERFVLVVDGIDEDVGFDATAGGHSIAAFLPRDLPTGMRAIVAGRPAPRLPYDVPDDHPLLDPAVIRPLTPSPEARALREVMVRDLKRVFEGTPLARALLGLTTAAGGGLTTADLAGLTGATEWEVEEVLSTAAGRGFARRPGPRPGRSADVHVLAHWELHRLAAQMYGRRLDDHRAGIHAWADRHRDLRWPEGTPEYLLGGYFAMLSASRDTTRMLSCATDPARRRRLRAMTGGDGAGLAEITATQDALLGDEHPDLVALTRLSVHRADLFGHTGRLPLSLPAGWAMLGDVDRARSMIDAFEEPHHRVSAFLTASRAVRRVGRTVEADELLDRAEKTALPLDRHFTSAPLRWVIDELARIGAYERAETAVDRVAAAERPLALASLAVRAADRGDHERAFGYVLRTEGSLSLHPEHGRVVARAEAAVAAAKLGDRASSTKLLDAAERDLEPDDFYWTVDAPDMARAAAQALDHDRALRIAGMIKDLARREQALLSIIRVVVEHDPARAEAIARSITRPAGLGMGLALVAGAAADRERADRLIAEVERAADQVPEAEWRDEVLPALVAALARRRSGLDRAEDLARRHAVGGSGAESLVSVAASALREDDPVRTADLLAAAEELARATPGPDEERLAVLWIGTMAARGDVDRAAADAGRLRDPMARSAAWAAVAHGALENDLVDVAASALSSVEDPQARERARLELVRVLLATGDVDRAEQVARTATDPAHRIAALTAVAEATRKGEVLDEVESVIDATTPRATRTEALIALTETAARIGDRRRMHHLVDRLRSAGADDGSPTTMAIALPGEKPQLRGYTEVLEFIAQRKFPTFSSWPRDHTTVAPAESPYRKRVRGLPEGQYLAQRLCTTDWRYVVHQLVAFRPETYDVIVEELNGLAAHRSG
ncbi:hypothetical protein ACFXGA_38945 [Actinosynnema sp. NPDC059335]|uniref:hypothetical protein n=1 Tax=Actinosynnema sp. NPDC059335 TaxID=3346804 RepID=UPI00366A5E44